MVLALKDKWIWDFWLARDGEDWHIFFLQADKSLIDPVRRHRNVSIGHATSRDLSNWDHKGTCFVPAEHAGFDDFTTWTGSVLRGPNGLWHLFYTGTTRAEDGMIQRIGHATSVDLNDWQRVGTGLALDLSGPQYEVAKPDHWHDRAMRDPWVMPDPTGDGYLMYFTARLPGLANANAGGTLGLATSRNLDTWTLVPPVHAGGQFGQLEVPQVFTAGGRWYCLFSTAAEHWSDAYRKTYPGHPVTGTHYLVADNPRGPWQVAPGPFLDGAEPANRYSGRVAMTDGGLMYLAFVETPDGHPFVGEICDPIPLDIDTGGRLHLRHAADRSSMPAAL